MQIVLQENMSQEQLELAVLDIIIDHSFSRMAGIVDHSVPPCTEEGFKLRAAGLSNDFHHRLELALASDTITDHVDLTRLRQDGVYVISRQRLSRAMQEHTDATSAIADRLERNKIPAHIDHNGIVTLNVDGPLGDDRSLRYLEEPSNHITMGGRTVFALVALSFIAAMIAAELLK